MTQVHRSELLDEFLAHYQASETRGAVDMYLSGLRVLAATPREGQIEEGPEGNGTRYVRPGP